MEQGQKPDRPSQRQERTSCVPSQRATRFAGVEPATVNSPPATIEFDQDVNARTLWFIPPPTADQDEPDHFAIDKAVLPPAVVNVPPA